MMNHDDTKVLYCTCQPTTFCNLDCDYCYLPHRRQQRRAEPELFLLLAEKLRDEGLVGRELCLAWHNCEPLSMPTSFYEEVFAGYRERLPGVALEHRFVSNGTLVNERWVEFFLRHGITPTISLDGPALLHDRHRRDIHGRTTHERAQRGLQLLQAAGLSPPVICVVTADSLASATELITFFADLGVRRLGFSAEESEGCHRSTSMQAGQLAYTRFLIEAFAANARLAEPLWLRELERFRGAAAPGTRQRQAVLSPGTYLGVDVEGGITTWSPEMLGWPQFVLGNLRSASLRELLASEALAAQKAAIQRGVDQCRASCGYFDLCGGGDPSNKYAEFSRFDVAETSWCRNAIQASSNAVFAHLSGSTGRRGARAVDGPTARERRLAVVEGA